MDGLPDLAVREGQWKLLCDYDGGRPELYDLESDPGEQNDLAQTHPDVTADLSGKAVAWYRTVAIP